MPAPTRGTWIDQAGGRPIYGFGPFRLDVSERQLLRDGQPAALTPKAFDLLVYFVEHPNCLLDKDTLLAALWPDTVVEEANLAFQVSTLRKVLDDGREGPSLIQTVPTRGYRFVADVTAAPRIARHVKVRRPRPWWRRGILLAGCAAVLILGGLMEIRRSRHASGGAAAPVPVVSSSQLHIRKLTDNEQATDVAISPDARYVAFVRGGDGLRQSLWLRQIDTRTDVEILPSQGVGLSGLTFSPDGTLIYFVKHHADNPFAGSLYSMSMLGGSAQKVIDDIKAPISFAPDRNRFVYESCWGDGVQFRVARVDRDDDRQLGTIPRARCGAFQPGPSWSPDGRTIVATVFLTTGQWIVASVSADDGVVRHLVSSGYRFGRPIWLLGSHSLLVPHVEEDFKELQLWTVTVPGGEAHRLTDDLTWYSSVTGNLGLGRLDATPDGRTAVSLASTRVSNIWVVPVEDPTEARQVSSGLPVFKATELADGRILAVDYEGRLWTMNQDGGERTPFTSLRHVDHFVRCGKEVVAVADMTSDRTPSPTIWTAFRVHADGLDATPLIEGTFGAPGCSGLGGYLFYTDKGRLLRIPIVGGQPQEVGSKLGCLPSPVEVSPDGTRVACLQSTELAGSAEGLKLTVVRADDGSSIASWPVRLPAGNFHAFRWFAHGVAWRFFRADGGGVNIWEQPIPDGRATPLTRFSSGTIFNFEASLDGKRLVMTRGGHTHDVVLLTFN